MGAPQAIADLPGSSMRGEHRSFEFLRHHPRRSTRAPRCEQIEIDAENYRLKEARELAALKATEGAARRKKS